MSFLSVKVAEASAEGKIIVQMEKYLWLMHENLTQGFLENEK